MWPRGVCAVLLLPVVVCCVLQHPIRSVVMPFHDDDAAVQITTAVKRVLRDLLSPDSVWWQEEHLMHAPLFHATVQEVRSAGGDTQQQ